MSETPDLGRTNLEAALSFLAALAESGLRHVVAGAGSRSAPLALAADARQDLRLWMVTDERSAAFFALGLIKASASPVMVLSTSGTAAANFLPAVTEAYNTELPLLIVTADRPPELRACGAAQTIVQPELFHRHVVWQADLPAPETDPETDKDTRSVYAEFGADAYRNTSAKARGPVHVNFPFREPLLPESSLAASMLEASAEMYCRGGKSRPAGRTRSRNPIGEEVALRGSGQSEKPNAGECFDLDQARGLIVCGSDLDEADARAIQELSTHLGWPLLADPLSGFRWNGAASKQVIDAYDLFLRSSTFVEQSRPNAVLRFGGMPTSKVLNLFLAESNSADHVWVGTFAKDRDPITTRTKIRCAKPSEYCREVLGVSTTTSPSSSSVETEWSEAWARADRIARRSADQLLDSEDNWSEALIARELVDVLPDGAWLHVGNSMPIRELDSFGAKRAKRIRVTGNRGANGIDGLTSTALGIVALESKPTVLFVGDLSFLQDLSGLQIAWRYGLSLLIVVVNNDGGGIFGHLPQSEIRGSFERVFSTPHGLDLEPTIALGGGHYRRVSDRPTFREALSEELLCEGLRVIEVAMDRTVNLRARQEYLRRITDRIDESFTPSTDA